MRLFLFLPANLIRIGLIFVDEEFYPRCFIDVCKPKFLCTQGRFILYNVALSLSDDDSSLTVDFLIYVLHLYQQVVSLLFVKVGDLLR